jgi:hypothetical protein
MSQPVVTGSQCRSCSCTEGTPAITDESKTRRICALIACAALIAPAVTRGAAMKGGDPLIGVLEELPGAYVGEASRHGVRVLFRRVGSDWQPFPNDCSSADCLTSLSARYPQHVRWAVSFGGRRIGTVAAHTPAVFRYYSQIGVQDMDAGQAAPMADGASVDYSGFQETPVHRPLLATAGKRALTPSNADWKPQAATHADLHRVWSAFRRLTPLIDDCRLDSHGENVPSEGRAPRRNELEIAGTWVDRSGDAIIHARVRRAAFENCEGPLEHKSDYWFYREASGKAWPLPGQDLRGSLVMPVDFVHVGGNSGDVALFLLAGYNAGGYELFFDGFRKVAHFTWSYH